MAFVGSRACSVVLWLLIGVYAVVTDLSDAAPKIFQTPANLPLTILVPMAFALLHGARRYGIAGILWFTVLCLGISNVMENMGVLTGFPFGPYHYTDVLGPKLFLVPLLIGPGYLGTGYVSWVLADILLGAGNRRDALATIATPLLATFIMVGWDACLDPGSATIAKIWIWHTGGGYFGVPLTNYLGWFLTVFLFMQAFALYLRARSAPLLAVPDSHWFQAAAFFLVMALDFPAGYLGITSSAVTDATGKVWQTGDIVETSAIVSLFTMMPFAVASFLTLMLRRKT